MTETSPAAPIAVGLDDGYALTKVALPGERLSVIPSRARGTAWSGLNRVIVQHALQQAGLAGRTVHAVSGLPVSAFYRKSGALREEQINRKRDSLKQAVRPVSARPAEIAFHEVIPEALAAWYDHVIVERGEEAAVDEKRLSVPIAVVDIGGRTTDYVVVQDQGIVHASSGSLPCGMLDVKQNVADAILEHFDLEVLGEQRLAQAVEHGTVRLQGADHDVTALVEDARREVVERIHAETRRALGLGTELDCVLFAGGGAVALAEQIRGWFPHQVIAEHAAFANARGMSRYLRHVCEVPNAP